MELHKTIQYKEIYFNLEMQLYTEVERRMGGKTFHELTISAIGARNYSKKYRIENNAIQMGVSNAIRDAEHWVDFNGATDPAVKLLMGMGFHKEKDFKEKTT